MKKRLSVLWIGALFISVFAGCAFGGLREALNKSTQFPKDPAAQAELARAYNQQGYPGKASLVAKGALALQPAFAPAILELAHASRLTGYYEKAVILYESFLAACPGSVEALGGYSESLARLQRWDESFASAMAAIKESPKDSAGYGALGRAYRLAGRLEEAAEILTQGLAFQSDSVEILYDLGLCHGEMGDRSAALLQYEKLLELNRKTAELLFEALYP